MKQVLDARCPWCFAVGVGVVVLSGVLLMGRGEAQASRVQVQAEADANRLLEVAGFGWIQVRISEGQARLEGVARDDAMRGAALAAARQALAPMMGFPGVFAAIADGMTVFPASADGSTADATVAESGSSGNRGARRREDFATGDTPAICEAALKKQLSSQPILFDFASIRLSPESLAALTALLPLFKTCPPAMLTVVAHADASGDLRRNEYLALARAQAVQAALSQAGLLWPSTRLKGVVDAQPVSELAGDPAAVRRVEFLLSSTMSP